MALGGFNLVELMSVIAITGILAGLALPALSKANHLTHKTQCLRNLSRMGIAWNLYLADYQEKLAPASGRPQWVDGFLDLNSSNPNNWDINRDITKSLLWPYGANDASVWRCPSDTSTVKVAGLNRPRVRSISMNGWLGSDNIESWSPGFRVYRKLSDLLNPGPALTWVMMDEREDSINDGQFVVQMSSYGGNSAHRIIVSYPASYHNGAGVLVFADGRVEGKLWLDPRTKPPLRKGSQLTLNVLSPNNPDVLWLQERTTRSY